MTYDYLLYRKNPEKPAALLLSLHHAGCGQVRCAEPVPTIMDEFTVVVSIPGEGIASTGRY
jgi:hypothetical protein